MKNIHRHFVQMLFAGMFAATATFAQEAEEYSVESSMGNAVEDPATVQATENSIAEPVEAPTKKRAKKVRPAREHRGFYFSAGLGLSYTSFNYKENDSEELYHYDYNNYEDSYTYERVEKESSEFSGFAIPTLDMRFGKSMGNLAALYFELDIATLQGRGKYKDTFYDNSASDRIPVLDQLPQHLEEDIIKDNDAYGISGFIGIGVTFYPFRNPNSVMNGAFFSIANGPIFNFADIEDSSRRDNKEIGMIGYGVQIELGKDWWVSDTWSIGVSASYMTIADFEDHDSSDANVFRILFRITRG